MDNKEFLRRLYKENGLSKHDTFVMTRGGKEIPLILRSGIEKIQQHNGIKVSFDAVALDPKFVVIKATGTDSRGSVCETFGEAAPANTSQAYPVAMAEKRALSRVVLKLAGMYQHGAMGEDEMNPNEDVLWDVEPLRELMYTSTLDAHQQRVMEARINSIKNQNDYISIHFELTDNQLSPMDRPHGRMSAKEIKQAIK